nr:BTAD domain-containing putative transcriptional regulator [Nakamurella aerolata]
MRVFDGSTELALHGQKEQRVLAALLVQAGRSVPMHRLIRSVWDEDPPVTADHQVRKAIAQLRQQLAGDPDVAIRTDSAGYRLELPAERLDLLVFTAATKAAQDPADPAGAADRLRQGVDQWHGPALAGLASTELQAAAQHLEELRLAAVEQLADLEVTLQRPAAAVQLLSGLVAEHRTRESLVARLMLALDRSGRPSDALRLYDGCRRLLDDELGVSPGAELAGMYQRILTADPGSPAAAERDAAQPAATGPDPAPAVTDSRQGGGDASARPAATDNQQVVAGRRPDERRSRLVVPVGGAVAATPGATPIPAATPPGMPQPGTPQPRALPHPRAGATPDIATAGAQAPGRHPAAGTGPQMLSTLPYDLPDFTGRAPELTALEMLLPEPDVRRTTIVVLQGMPGVGKTAMAVHAAHRWRSRYPDCQFFLDLHGLTEGRDRLEPEEALDRLLRWIGVPGNQIPNHPDERAALWRDGTAGLKMLLVLDNAVDSSQVRALIPGSDDALVIATSRAGLPGLDGSVPLLLTPPSAEDGQAFLAATLGRERLDAEPGMADRLLECCGRLPLAVRMASARLQARPHWQLAKLVDRLRSAERPHKELTVEGRGVDAAIRLSYNGLSPQQQRFFRLLCHVTDETFSPYLAAAAAGLPTEQGEALLEQLLDARMIESPRPQRYQLHDLMRSFGADLIDADEADTAQRCYHDALLAGVRAAAAALQPDRAAIDLDLNAPDDAPTFDGDAAAYAWLDEEYPTIRASALRAPALGLHRHAIAYARELTYYLQVRGATSTQLALLSAAVASAQALGDRDEELRGRINLFPPLWGSGDIQTARRHAEQALQLSRELGSRRWEGVCLANVGVVLRGAGQFRDAMRYFHQALAIHREVGNSRQENSVLIAISLVLTDLGEHAQALRTAAEVEQRVRNQPSVSRRVIPTINLAQLQARHGDAEIATELYASARRSAESIGMPLATALIDIGMADLLARKGFADEQHAGWPTADAGPVAPDGSTTDLAAALRMARAGARSAGQLGEPGVEASAANTLGLVHWRRGEWEQAETAYRLAAELAPRAHEVAEHLTALVGLALVAQVQGADSTDRWAQATALAGSLDGAYAARIGRCRRAATGRVGTAADVTT